MAPHGRGGRGAPEEKERQEDALGPGPAPTEFSTVLPEGLRGARYLHNQFPTIFHLLKPAHTLLIKNPFSHIRNEVLIRAAAWTSLENIMLSEGSQT